MMGEDYSDISKRISRLEKGLEEVVNEMSQQRSVVDAIRGHIEGEESTLWPAVKGNKESLDRIQGKLGELYSLAQETHTKMHDIEAARESEAELHQAYDTGKRSARAIFKVTVGAAMFVGAIVGLKEYGAHALEVVWGWFSVWSK